MAHSVSVRRHLEPSPIRRKVCHAYDATTTAPLGSRDGPYSGLPNKLVRAANGIDYAYRDTGPGASGGVPLVLFQHFRGNLDSWDPALIDALASARRVITFDNAGVGGSTGTTPNTVEQMARDAIAFIAAMEFGQVDLLGFSIGSFVAQQVALTRPAIVRQAGPGVRGAAGRRRHARLGPRGHRRHRHPPDQPRGIPRRLLRPLLVKPAGRPASPAAHVRPDRGPGHGDNLGDS